MAGTFPTLSNGQVCMYPVQRSVSVATKVIRFANDTQQRFQTAPILNAWVLEYRSLTWANLSTLRTFFQTQKGQFDKSWTFPFDGTSYTAMTFDQDDFTYTETAEAINRYSVSLRCRQVAKSGSYSSGLSAVFPSIRTGVVTQLPFSTSERFKTFKVDMDSGQRYTYAARANPRRAWTLEFPALTNSELLTLMNFFLSMNGPLSTFSFTDPTTGSTYTTVRFADDTFTARYLSANVRAARVELEEFA